MGILLEGPATCSLGSIPPVPLASSHLNCNRHHLSPHTLLVHSCGNRSTSQSIQFLWPAATMISAIRTFNSQGLSHPVRCLSPEASLSGIFSTGMVLTRALSAAQLSSLLTAFSHHLTLSQIRTCFNISLVLNFISKIIPMCVELCHLSLLDVLGLLITLFIGCLTHCANLPLTQQFLDTLWLGSLSRFMPIWFLCGIRIANIFAQ